jgi:hypothetical protein
VRLTIDTGTATYEQAIAAVQAAYGLRPAVPAAWPDAPDAEPRNRSHMGVRARVEHTFARMKAREIRGLPINNSSVFMGCWAIHPRNPHQDLGVIVRQPPAGDGGQHHNAAVAYREQSTDRTENPGRRSTLQRTMPSIAAR